MQPSAQRYRGATDSSVHANSNRPRWDNWFFGSDLGWNHTPPFFVLSRRKSEPEDFTMIFRELLSIDRVPSSFRPGRWRSGAELYSLVGTFSMDSAALVSLCEARGYKHRVFFGRRYPDGGFLELEEPFASYGYWYWRTDSGWVELHEGESTGEYMLVCASRPFYSRMMDED